MDKHPAALKIDLRELVSHRTSVQADQTVGQVFHLFGCHRFEFMAVLEGERLLGMCSKRDLGMLLGMQYGFALFAGKPIRDHLQPNPVCIVGETPINDVFGLVFERDEEAFYDDVLLLGRDRKFLGFIFTQTLVKLQNRFHLQSIHLLEQQQREITEKNKQIEADLRMSRELQQSMLPEHYPVFPPKAESSRSAFRFQHRYHPFGIVGGDFFHIKQLGDLTAGIFIADVMGHGIRSALITAMLRGLLEEIGQEEMDPGQVLAHINGEMTDIFRQVENDVMFATAIYLTADASRGKITYATAGHPYPIHACGRTGLVRPIKHPHQGTLLGLFDDAVFRSHELAFEPGDSIILYTDGILEAENDQGEEFGLERVLETLVTTIRRRPSVDILEELILKARGFSANGQFTDDVCLIAVDLGLIEAAVNPC